MLPSNRSRGTKEAVMADKKKPKVSDATARILGSVPKGLNTGKLPNSKFSGKAQGNAALNTAKRGMR